MLQAVVKGCPEVFPSGWEGSEAPGSGLQQLHTAYSRVVDAAARKAGGQSSQSGVVPSPALPADVAHLIAVLLAAREPLALSLLQSLGLGAALLRRLPGWGCLFFTQEHRVYLLRECRVAE